MLLVILEYINDARSHERKIYSDVICSTYVCVCVSNLLKLILIIL
jgi:hypothetical protein